MFDIGEIRRTLELVDAQSHYVPFTNECRPSKSYDFTGAFSLRDVAVTYSVIKIALGIGHYARN